MIKPTLYSSEVHREDLVQNASFQWYNRSSFSEVWLTGKPLSSSRTLHCCDVFHSTGTFLVDTCSDMWSPRIKHFEYFLIFLVDISYILLLLIDFKIYLQLLWIFFIIVVYIKQFFFTFRLIFSDRGPKLANLQIVCRHWGHRRC